MSSREWSLVGDELRLDREHVASLRPGLGPGTRMEVEEAVNFRCAGETAELRSRISDLQSQRDDFARQVGELTRRIEELGGKPATAAAEAAAPAAEG